MNRKKINLIFLICMIIIPFTQFIFVNVTASIDDLNGLTVSSSILQVEPFSFTNDSGAETVLTTNKKYDYLQFECGVPSIDINTMKDMGTIRGVDSEGNQTIIYWYRVGVKVPINIYTTLDKYDAVPLGMNAQKVTTPVIFTNIQRVLNWLGGEAYGNYYVPTYTYLPTWRITNDIPESLTQIGFGNASKIESTTRSWFASNYFHGGTLNLKVIINPNLGIPAIIDTDNYTLTASKTAVSLASALTIGGFDTGLLDTNSKTFITGNYIDNDEEEDTTADDKIETEDIGTFGDATNLVSTDIMFNLKSIEQTETFTYTEGGGSISTSVGAQLYPTNWFTNESLIDNQKPSANKTTWKVPYDFNALRPKLSVYVTNYQVNEFHARIDIEDEPLFFGTAGIRSSQLKLTSYCGVSAWRVDNYYIHDNLGFTLDIVSDYKITPKEGGYDGTDLEPPTEKREDEYWINIIEGLLAEQETRTLVDDWASFWANNWQTVLILAIILLVAVLGIIIAIKSPSRRKKSKDISDNEDIYEKLEQERMKREKLERQLEQEKMKKEKYERIPEERESGF